MFLLGAESERAKFRAFAHERKSVLLTVEGLRQLAWLGDDSGVDAAIMQLSTSAARSGRACRAGARRTRSRKLPALEKLRCFRRSSGPNHARDRRSRGRSPCSENAVRSSRSWSSISAGNCSRYCASMGDRRSRSNRCPSCSTSSVRSSSRAPVPRSCGASRPRSWRAIRSATPRCFPRCLLDVDLEAARRAASGVARIAEPRRREILKKALAGAMPSRRGIYLDGLMRGGGVDAVLALLAAADGESDDQRWLLADMVFQAIRMWSDPRGGDALARFVDTKPHAHWETQAALALAEIGDLRAVPALDAAAFDRSAERIRRDAGVAGPIPEGRPTAHRGGASAGGSRRAPSRRASRRSGRRVKRRCSSGPKAARSRMRARWPRFRALESASGDRTAASLGRPAAPTAGAGRRSAAARGVVDRGKRASPLGSRRQGRRRGRYSRSSCGAARKTSTPAAPGLRAVTTQCSGWRSVPWASGPRTESRQRATRVQPSCF